MLFFLGRIQLFLFEGPISSLCHPVCGVPLKVGDAPWMGEPFSETSGRWLIRERKSDFSRAIQNLATTGYSMKQNMYKHWETENSGQPMRVVKLCRLSVAFLVLAHCFGISLYPLLPLKWFAGGALGEHHSCWSSRSWTQALATLSLPMWPWWAVSALWTLIFFTFKMDHNSYQLHGAIVRIKHDTACKMLRKLWSAIEIRDNRILGVYETLWILS